MRPAATAIPLLLLAAACGGGGGAPAGGPPEVRVLPGAAEVEFGRAFPLEVVRSFDRGQVPGEWEDAALAPLVVRREGTERRAAGGRVVETLRFRAHAFGLGTVRVPPVRFEVLPPAGGPALAASSAPFEVRVLPSLDPREPGPAEFPSGPLPVPGRRWPALLAAAAVLLAAGLLVGRSRGGRTGPAAEVPGGDALAEARERARRRLEGIAARGPSAGEAAGADFVEVAALLRDLLAEGHGLPARERTTEEVLAAPVLGAFPAREALGSALRRADLVKFALDAPGPGDRERLLAEARAAVEGTGGAP